MAKGSWTMKLLCVVCMIKFNRDREAITVYSGQAVCGSHLALAIKTKKEKIW